MVETVPISERFRNELNVVQKYLAKVQISVHLKFSDVLSRRQDHAIYSIELFLILTLS